MYIGLIHVNLGKSLTYRCLSKKILGGSFLSMFFCVVVCLRLQKNPGSRILIGSNIVLEPFPCGQAFLHIFYVGIYWKTAKIAYFCYYEPLNVVFGGNFIPWLERPYTRDFLSKLCNFKILAYRTYIWPVFMKCDMGIVT